MLPRSREKTFVRILIVFFILTEVTFIVFVYTYAATSGSITYPDIYISDTIQVDPGRAVATYLVPLAAWAFVVILGMHLNRIEPLLRTRTDLLLWYASIILLAGVFVGRIGAVAVPSTTQQWVHAVAAGMLYICSVLLFTALTLLDDLVGLDRSQKVRKLRIAFCVQLWIFGILFALTVGWLPQVAVIAELLVSGLILNYVATYFVESEFRMKSTFASRCFEPEYPSDTPPA